MLFLVSGQRLGDLRLEKGFLSENKNMKQET